MRYTSGFRPSSLRALLASGALCLTGGCAEDAVSVFIRQVNVPVLVGANGCTLNNDVSGLRVYEGLLDLSFRNGYVLSPLLQSEILTRADPASNRPGAQYVVIEGFVIEVHDSSPTGPIIDRPFTVYQTVLIPPSVLGAPSLVSTSIEVIPPAITRQIAGVCQIDTSTVTPECPVPRYRSNDRRLIVRIRAFGKTSGGVTVETPTYDFPVNVCCHCLVRFPTDSNMLEAAATTLGPGVGAGPDCNQGIAPIDNSICNFGQDIPLDCRLCSSRSAALCQPPGYSPTGRSCPQ